MGLRAVWTRSPDSIVKAKEPRRLMSEGTKSYLFGCHHFFFHPLFVLMAWVKLYRRWPKWWELVCIFLHDIGHIGKQYLSHYEEKKQHWVLGAEIAYKLFGPKGYAMVAGHVTQAGVLRSKLYKPDKHSWIIAWKWWLRFNRVVEPQLKAATVEEFQQAVEENIKGGYQNGNHSIYLRYTNGRRYRRLS